MTWGRKDDQGPHHRKARRVGLDGWGLHDCGIAYCNRYLTDGRIPKDDLPDVWPWDSVTPLVTIITRLIDAKLWHDDGDHWVVNDFLVYNPSRASVMAKRKQNRERQKRHRHGVTNAVTAPVSNAPVAGAGGHMGIGGGSGSDPEGGVQRGNGHPRPPDDDRDDQHERDARPFKGRLPPAEHRVWAAFEKMCTDAGLRQPSRTIRHVKRLRAALKRHDADTLVTCLEAFPGHADHSFKGGETWGNNATPDILFREHNVERMLAWARTNTAPTPTPADVFGYGAK
jgi:hypothetical protein